MTMNRIHALLIPSLTITVPAASAHPENGRASNPNDWPNIVLFYLDDMGYGDLTWTGAINYATPNIDRLAYDGMFFTQYYAPSPVSSASRAGMMTGCYPTRVGIGGVLSASSDQGLSPDEWILPEMLKEQGYATGMVGKWHLGKAPEFLPLRRGFDEFLGLPYSNDMWPYGHAAKRGEKPAIVNTKNPPLPLYDGEKVVEYMETMEQQDQLTTRYTERAVSFIQRHAGRKPFFLYVAHSMPHVPLAVSDKFRGKSEQGMYGDVMMELDWSVGEIMQALKENGIDDNTLVIFTSDNGPWLNFGNHQGSAGGLKEGKHTSFEGGQRVPCIMRWPRVIPRGIICNRLCSGIDFLPTIAEITGGRLSPNKIDGVSMLPLLRNEPGPSPRKYFVYCSTGPLIRAVRDAAFKLVAPHNYGSYEENLPGCDGKAGKRSNKSTDWALYDMRRDPGERYNVFEMYPETVERLKAVLREMAAEIGDKRSGQIGKEIRSAAKAVRIQPVTHEDMSPCIQSPRQR